MDTIILKVVYKLVSAIGDAFPILKNLSSMEAVILATIILSMIIAIFSIFDSLLKKKTIRNAFNLFMYSFLGGLLGGFTGIVIGLLLSSLIYLIIPPQCDFICDVFYPIRLMILLFMCWFVGVMGGVILTIRPLIKFFSKRNR